MTQGKQLATFKLEPQTWKDFQMWATDQGSNAAAALRWFIDEALSGRINLTSAEHAAAIESLDSRIAAMIDERLAAMLEATQNKEFTTEGQIEPLQSDFEEGTDTSAGKNIDLPGDSEGSKTGDSAPLSLFDEIKAMLGALPEK